MNENKREKQGKALSEELTGYRSIRAVGQRYRIIYQIVEDKVLVVVVGIGRRKEGDKRDVYTVTMRLLVDMMLESSAGMRVDRALSRRSV